MQINYGNNLIEMSDEFSFNKGSPEKISDGINVYATVFSMENPDSQVFRKDIKGVTFYNCNLDNCIVPEGNTVVGGSQRRFKVQNDGNDWLIDELNNPLLPIDHKMFTKFRLPMPDPKDIPVQKVIEIINLKKVAEEKLAIINLK